ncbi:fas apoptotic inhibitory molecule 1 isoform X1 [Bombus affinis]|uniref:Fas apoptotic inhibitory molecule 1 n=1 Tax=Bombus terrestris TaxID=30195 RepID=A0A9B0F672_BOMTE|nr:fas apoptotic inhibitory molecule 1 [Bombus terrestris]XP_050591368.1 fas apoptotic inhibitory molecule 1 isoform X1 [Bombus affinis]
MAAMLLKSLHTLESLEEPTAKWSVPLSDGNHVIEFEHGTATGRRLVKVDGEKIIYRDWMFHLVGDEVFTFNDNKFVIRIDPIRGLKYSYSLWVNGKPYKSFVRSQSKILETWLANVRNEEYRIVLDKQTQNVWVNGQQTETENEFTDDGAEILFTVGDLPASIRTYSSGQKNIGITYSLCIDEIEIGKETLLDEDADM